MGASPRSTQAPPAKGQRRPVYRGVRTPALPGSQRWGGTTHAPREGLTLPCARRTRSAASRTVLAPDEGGGMRKRMLLGMVVLAAGMAAAGWVLGAGPAGASILRGGAAGSGLVPAVGPCDSDIAFGEV